jgi:farnesyl diphosphate synthase
MLWRTGNNAMLGNPVLFDLQGALNETSDALVRKMDALLPESGNGEARILSFSKKPRHRAANDDHEPKFGENKIIAAMRYSALSGGKRLRPFLTVSAANLFGVSLDASLQTAAAIEFMHTYSLIHDDLPAMDDDELRRGQPACHIKFGEAAAILAGDALLTYAFQILSDPSVHPDAGVRCELVRALAVAGGYRGMVGGQMLDLDAENMDLAVDEVIRLQRLKTGELFAISCEAGAILGKAPRVMRNVLRAYAHDLGLAFQITDDLLDVEGTRTDAGKKVDKDRLAGKATLVSIMGVEQARDHAQILAKQAVAHLDVFDKKADNLRKLAEFVVSRRK